MKIELTTKAVKSNYYSSTCIQRSPLGQGKGGLLRQVILREVHSITGQEKGDLLIQVTT